MNFRTWQDALVYLVDQKDAPPAAQHAAKDAFETFHYACSLHQDEMHAAHTATQTLHDLQRDLPRNALNAARAGKRLNLDAQLRDIEKARAAAATAQARVEVTLHVFRKSESEITGGCLVDHRDDLLQWIANRRNAAPHQCGPVETLPPQVQTIYSLVRPTWSDRWDEALSLNAATRLPLIYSPQWDTDVRASLAWVWEQLALGHVAKIPHPHSRNPDKAQSVLIPTQRVVRLPQVPPATPLRPPF